MCFQEAGSLRLPSGFPKTSLRSCLNQCCQACHWRWVGLSEWFWKMRSLSPKVYRKMGDSFHSKPSTQRLEYSDCITNSKSTKVILQHVTICTFNIWLSWSKAPSASEKERSSPPTSCITGTWGLAPNAEPQESTADMLREMSYSKIWWVGKILWQSKNPVFVQGFEGDTFREGHSEGCQMPEYNNPPCLSILCEQRSALCTGATQQLSVQNYLFGPVLMFWPDAWVAQ